MLFRSRRGGVFHDIYIQSLSINFMNPGRKGAQIMLRCIIKTFLNGYVAKPAFLYMTQISKNHKAPFPGACLKAIFCWPLQYIIVLIVIVIYGGVIIRHGVVFLHFPPDEAGGNPHNQRYHNGYDRVRPNGYASLWRKIFDAHHHR